MKHATLANLSSPTDTAKENKAKNNIDLWSIVSNMVHPESTATQTSANKCIGGILVACLAVHLRSFWVLLLWKIKLGYALYKDVFHRTESVKKYLWLVRKSAFFSHYISNLLLICEMLDQCNQHLWHDLRGPNDANMWSVTQTSWIPYLFHVPWNLGGSIETKSNGYFFSLELAQWTFQIDNTEESTMFDDVNLCPHIDRCEFMHSIKVHVFTNLRWITLHRHRRVCIGCKWWTELELFVKLYQYYRW